MKAISVVAALSAVLLSAPVAAQSNYPDKPIRIMVGFTPGSATDVTARLFAQKLTDVIGGRVTMALQNAGSILPTVRAGTLRGLAITSLKRSPSMPELPTVAESGFPDFEAISWFGLLAPAGTPAPIVGKLYQETS